MIGITSQLTYNEISLISFGKILEIIYKNVPTHPARSIGNFVRSIEKTSTRQQNFFKINEFVIRFFTVFPRLIITQA